MNFDRMYMHTRTQFLKLKQLFRYQNDGPSALLSTFGTYVPVEKKTKWSVAKNKSKHQ